MELLKNKEKLNEPWDIDIPIENLFKRIEQVAKFTQQAGDSLTDKKKVATAYTLIKNTGEFNAACRSWRHKPEADKTWANLKPYFIEEYDSYKEDHNEDLTTK